MSTATAPKMLLGPAECADRSERWRAARLGGIGASEIAEVLGLSPWGSAHSLYWRKLGWPDLDSRAMRRGRLLEEFVAAEFADTHPQVSVVDAGLYVHPQRPWQLASPDRLLYTDGDPDDPHRRPAGLLECKTANGLDDWGEEDSDDIPVHYRAQALWQADVLGVDRVHVWVLGPHFRTYRYVVDHDPDDLARMVDAAGEFIDRVKRRDPPRPDWHPASTEALRWAYPRRAGAEVEVDPKLAAAYASARAAKTAAERRYEQVKNQLRAAMGDGQYAVCQGRRVASRSVYEEHRVDVARLREERPDVAEEYETEGTVDKIVPATRRST